MLLNAVSLTQLKFDCNDFERLKSKILDEENKNDER